ncbi:hypothetical protein T11_13474 [Trichinella zimbabwensis]|uniref:Uncharacterized protein n=1 Tax=Trichinella zimbabwensis TaxID=268475 RepID=A0A0V1GFN0_9BILA|nr:hypothetical protein T11_13474 [Trichinella zimbabwensis]
MHCKSVGRKKLSFSIVGRSPEKFENHWSRALVDTSDQKQRL